MLHGPACWMRSTHRLHVIFQCACGKQHAALAMVCMREAQLAVACTECISLGMRICHAQAHSSSFVIFCTAACTHLLRSSTCMQVQQRWILCLHGRGQDAEVRHLCTGFRCVRLACTRCEQCPACNRCHIQRSIHPHPRTSFDQCIHTHAPASINAFTPTHQLRDALMPCSTFMRRMSLASFRARQCYGCRSLPLE
jgi:hypothetical protein